MTPAINLLKKHKIPFEIHQYHHDPNNTDFGKEAVELLNLQPEQTFKTLLVAINEEQKNLAVMIIPVNMRLNLKKAANALKVKRIALAEKSSAEKSSGYLIGGISPLAQKKRLPTFINDSATDFNTIFVSGGKRGIDIEISPIDLQKLCSANFAPLGDET